jgi:hypothetical protein
MEKLTRTEVNCTTGEITIVELTKEEIKQFETAKAKAEFERTEAESQAKNKELARLVILEKLGLTAEEVALLIE